MDLATRVVLSDLDDTLFDHTHATRQSLVALRKVSPELGAWSIDALEARHRVILETLHLQVLAGQLTIDVARIARFTQLLVECGADDAAGKAHEVAGVYRRAYSSAWQPVAGALALAAAVKSAGLSFIIVTNNNVAEQQLKIERCGFAPFVDALITSEEVGVSKPDPRIFEHALERARTTADTAVMIGDAWGTDIEGARRAGVRAVWFNRTGATSPDPEVPEIRSLEPTSETLRVLSFSP